MKRYDFLGDIWSKTTLRYRLDLFFYGIAVLLGGFAVGQPVRLLLNSLQKGSFDAFRSYIGLGLLALGLSAALRYFAQYALFKQSDRIGEQLFNSLMDTVLNLPYHLSGRYDAGDLESRMTYDVRSAIRIYRLDMGYLAKLIIGGTGNLILIFNINRKIGLLAVVFGLTGYGVNMVFLKPVRQLAGKLSRSHGDMAGVLLEAIRGSAEIRIFHMRNRLAEKFQVRNREMKAVGLDQNRIAVIQSLIQTLTGYLNTFVFLGISLLFVQSGELLFGDVMAAFYYAQTVVSLFTDISGALSSMQNSCASMIRMNEILDSASAGESRKGPDRGRGRADMAREGREAVAFEGVSFSYEKGVPVLRDLSFHVTAGNILLIKGESGSGKSTIGKLLLGLYPGYTGKLRLWGENVENLSSDELRHRIAYVPQSPCLFQGSILENIALAREGASREEVEEAAGKANLTEFIAGLPRGYETETGEAGTLLSGGQRQRIAIARAFLKDASVWVLDEPLSALDSLNAEALYEIFSSVLWDKTLLMISHRGDEEELKKRFGERLQVLRL